MRRCYIIGCYMTILTLLSSCLFQANAITLQDPAKFLKTKLDAKLDTNPYFLKILENKEYNQHYTCNYQEGPYCSLLSNATYEKVEDTFVTDNIRNYLKQQMLAQTREMEGHLSKQSSFLPSYYYLDKTRAILDEELFFKPIEKNYPYRLLIDFNIIESIEDQKSKNELNKYYVVNLNNGAQATSASSSFGKEYLTLKFTNFYYNIPKVYAQQTHVTYIDKIDELNAQANMVYLSTKDLTAQIDFNYNVQLQTFYAKSNPVSFEKSSVIQIKGYDQKQKLVFEKVLQLQSQNQNQFQKFTLDKNYTVSSLSFSKNIQIDNLVLHIDRKEVNDFPQLYIINHDSSPSIEVQEMQKSFEYDSQVITSKHTNSKDTHLSKDASKGNTKPQRIVRLTKEERKARYQIIKSQSNKLNDVQQIIAQNKQKPIFDEQKILQDLVKVTKQHEGQMQDIVQEIVSRLKIISKLQVELDKENAKKNTEVSGSADKINTKSQDSSKSTTSNHDASQKTDQNKLTHPQDNSISSSNSDSKIQKTKSDNKKYNKVYNKQKNIDDIKQSNSRDQPFTERSQESIDREKRRESQKQERQDKEINSKENQVGNQKQKVEL